MNLCPKCDLDDRVRERKDLYDCTPDHFVIDPHTGRRAPAALASGAATLRLPVHTLPSFPSDADHALSRGRSCRPGPLVYARRRECAADC